MIYLAILLWLLSGFFQKIWDTAGQERFRSMTSAFYSKAQGVVVTFDVSERDTFLALPSWIRDIRMVSGDFYLKSVSNDIHRVLPATV